MGDLVNDYFKQFYPKDLPPRGTHPWRFSGMMGGMWRYEDYNVSNTFPPMVCEDGFKFSVQGHCGTYSQPRDDFAKCYTKVEVGFPSEREELLMPYIDDERAIPTETVYGYVPIELIEQIVAKHGGLKP